MQYATDQEGTAKTRIYLDTLLPGNVVNSSVVVFRPAVQNASKGSLIFPTGGSEFNKFLQEQKIQISSISSVEILLLLPQVVVVLLHSQHNYHLAHKDLLHLMKTTMLSQF